jgi:hypothetical protein
MITRKQLVSRIVATLRTKFVIDLGRSVEEVLSESKSLGDAFDRGGWSFQRLVGDVRKSFQES